MPSFWSYMGGTVIKPHSTFSRLLIDPRQLIHGAKALLLIGVLYTLTVIGLAIVRAEIVFPAWIAIPAEDYYFWEIFFALPVYLLGWILAAGLVQLLSKVFKGSGTFEGNLAVLGFAITIPAFVTWIPETIGTILFLLGVMTQKEWMELASRPGFWYFFAVVYQVVALAWYIVLFWIAVAVTQKLHWWQAAIVGTLTIAIIGFVMIIFIR
ncbi:MAG: YIP1 family protein [Candidatus Aminicenantia bacterium]